MRAVWRHAHPSLRRPTQTDRRPFVTLFFTGKLVSPKKKFGCVRCWCICVLGLWKGLSVFPVWPASQQHVQNTFRSSSKGRQTVCWLYCKPLWFLHFWKFTLWKRWASELCSHLLVQQVDEQTCWTLLKCQTILFGINKDCHLFGLSSCLALAQVSKLLSCLSQSQLTKFC